MSHKLLLNLWSCRIFSIKYKLYVEFVYEWGVVIMQYYDITCTNALDTTTTFTSTTKVISIYFRKVNCGATNYPRRI